MMTPDIDRAATSAARTLLFHKVCCAPVDPLAILKKTPGVLVLSFAEMSQSVGMARKDALALFGDKGAVTSVKNGKYIVTCNIMLPTHVLQRSLARELGHIILGHDGSRPDDVREAEAAAFAYHLLSPRPLLRAVKDAGVRFTLETLGNLTGCYEQCLDGMRVLPGADVPAELNRALRTAFSDYVDNFINYHKTIAQDDHSALADFGTYFDNYKE